MFRVSFSSMLSMFCAFAEAGLPVKSSKCHLFLRQVKYVDRSLRKGKRSPGLLKKKQLRNGSGRISLHQKP